MNLQHRGRASHRNQRGNFLVGLIVGLLVGLALALGVALYIAKVPVPFINKVPQRTAEQDAAETEKNKNPAKPSVSASGAVAPLPAPASASAPTVSVAASAPKKDGRDPAAILAAVPAPNVASLPGKAGNDALSFYVQAGAYGRAEDAEAQRAKLAMMGLAAKVSDREQSGRTVYRVRLGPFDKKDEATAAKEKLEGSGVESALVQVQK